MRLSTRSRYGARLVLDMALHGAKGFLRLGEMAERLDVSVKYLEKLMRELQMAGYVTSKRGPAGGHGLTREPADISVGEVVRVLEGERALARCVESDGYCEHRGNCLMNWVWEEGSRAMFDRLDTITFADLVREAQRRRLSCDFSSKRTGA